MTKTQQKHLKERLQAAYAEKRSSFPSRWGPKPPMPEHVRRAAAMAKHHDKIVERWKIRIEKDSQSKRDRLDERKKIVEGLILFGTAEQALQAVKQFEVSK